MDLAGKRFSRLVVIGKAEPKGTVTYRWRCQCDCGKIKDIAQGSLTRGLTKSCGCIQKEFTINRQLKHGKSGDRLYQTWLDIKKRCYREKSKLFYRYGGRGIKVCDRWLNSFENFYADMGERPFYKAEIDRIDNDGDYSPENCRWVSKAENLRNRSDNVFMTLDGVTLCEADWATRLGVRRGMLATRRKRGWSTEDVLTKPKRGTK